MIGREKIEHDSQLDKLEKAGHHEFFLYNLLLVGNNNLAADKFYLNSGILTKGLEYTEEVIHHFEKNKYKNYIESRSMNTAYIVATVRNLIIRTLISAFDNMAASEYANTCQKLIEHEVSKHSSTYEVLPFVIYSKAEDLNK